MTVKTLTQAEITSRITLNTFHKALEADFVSTASIEAMCTTMFRLGISPLQALRNYLSKYTLDIEVVHVLLKNSTQKLYPNRVRFNRRKPTLVVVNYDNNGITRKVELLYHPAYHVKNKSKFYGIKFWTN